MEPKQLAAQKAVTYIKDGMVVGLGTGSTANFAIQEIARRIGQGLKIQAISSSGQSESLARSLGIPIVNFSEIEEIDIYLDGADLVDQQCNLIKGGGGALLREKLLAAHSKLFYVMVDESKLKNSLTEFALPIEITPFGAKLTIKKVESLGCKATIRQLGRRDFITENGNLVIDCKFKSITDPAELNIRIHSIPGVVETGLLTNSMVTSVIIAGLNGEVREIKGGKA